MIVNDPPGEVFQYRVGAAQRFLLPRMDKQMGVLRIAGQYLSACVMVSRQGRRSNLHTYREIASAATAASQ